jgi:hypothetical protein
MCAVEQTPNLASSINTLSDKHMRFAFLPHLAADAAFCITFSKVSASP